jgi:hypothetical protein
MGAGDCCAAGFQPTFCPVWVISRHHSILTPCPLYPPKADIKRGGRHVRLVPCVDGSELARLFFTFAGWSVQPCVRPVSAAHKAAGHNALRGSGPGQKPAFDNALALVGCPDRRIDRLCITCCSPSQPSHHAGWRRDLVHAASATGSL